MSEEWWINRSCSVAVIIAQSAALWLEKGDMLSVSWSVDDRVVPVLWRDWLLYAGSFMQRARAHGAICPAVSVVRQAWQRPLLEEKNRLALNGRHWALIREVLIHSNHQQWMFARTVFPRNSLTGPERQLARLKNRSLGSVLFRHADMQRRSFEYAQILPGTKLHAELQQLTGRQFESLWARRSIFWLGQKSLLLTEIFFPDVLALSK